MPLSNPPRRILLIKLRHHGDVLLTTPVARALIGKNEGDAITIEAPAGTREYEILSVAYKG